MTGRKSAKEGKKAAFFANAAGGKEQPIVIGKAAKLRCFKGIRDPKKPEGILYYSNPKAWMNTEVMTDILTALNRRLIRQGRNVLIFIDNVSSHDPALKDQHQDHFLPKNTTSKLQPLDAGIIQIFKVHYWRLLLKHNIVMLAQIDGTDLTATAIVKSIHVLTAIRWIKKAWEEVYNTADDD